MANFRDNHCVLQEVKNPQCRRIGEQECCRELCGTVNVWKYSEIANILLEL